MGRPKLNVGPCSIEGCENPAKTRGLCGAHYHKLTRYGDPLASPPAGQPRFRPTVCMIPGCGKPQKGRGWCSMHYWRWKTYGDPEATVRVYDGRSVMASGYVRIWVPEHPTASADGYALEHRMMWHDAHGPIPAGYQVHHKNEVKDDNRLDNFELLTESEHHKRHAAEASGFTNQYGFWPRHDKRNGAPIARLVWPGAS